MRPTLEHGVEVKGASTLLGGYVFPDGRVELPSNKVPQAGGEQL